MALMKSFDKRKSALSMRLVAIILLLLMSIFKLFLSYRGLNQPDVMDQAQIARSVANGQGFVSKYYRPVELRNAANKNPEQAIDLAAFKDVNHAPLNIVSMAVALKLTGENDFAAARVPMDENGDPKQNLYDADRTISAVSCLYFLLAMGLAYTLIARLFDEIVACATICCFAVCELMLDYAVSGLPQPLMLCCMLGGLHLLLSADRELRAENREWGNVYLVLSFVLMALMCLSGWLSIWVALGYCVFCAAYFRPYGMYGGIGCGVILLFCSYSLWSNYQMTGSFFGNSFYGIFNCFGGDSESALRTVDAGHAGIDSSMLVLKIFGSMLAQFKSLYVNCGSIIVAPFFFLSIFFRYKRSGVQCVKWALLGMWGFACMGMALYGTDVPLSSGQLAILFAPLFTAYGFSLLFNFMAKLNTRAVTFAQLRGITVLGVVLLSAGTSLASFPGDLYRGVWLREKGAPHYPPYYPPALNCMLHDFTNPQDVLITDQPWAVAWYADRRAIWIPRTIDDYRKINDEILPLTGVAAQGIVITPSSYDPIIPSAYAPTNHTRSGRPGGFSAVQENMGDFTALALNLPLAIMDPRNALYINNFMPNPNAPNSGLTRLGEIVNISNTGTAAQFDELVPLNAGAAVLYRKRAYQQAPSLFSAQ